MKIILRLLEFLLLCLCAFFRTSAQAQEPLPCRVYYLDLSTGVNQETYQPYTVGQTDPFWRIANGPAQQGPYPLCAQVVQETITSNGFGPARSISLNALSLATNLASGSSTCNFVEQPYLFERDFKVSTDNGVNASVMFQIERMATDDRLASITLLGPSGPTVLFNACFGNAIYNLPVLNLSLAPGSYTLQFQLGNIGVNANQGSPLFFKTKVYAYANEKVFQDNQHTGRNMICSPPYPVFEKPVLANTCVMAGETSCEVVIDNYQPNLTYSLNNGTFSSAFTFDAALHHTYILTATDAFGCTQKDTAMIDTCWIDAASFKLFIEGLYQPNAEMTPVLFNAGVSADPDDVDEITVEFRQAYAPYTLVRSAQGVLKKDGHVQINFPPVKSDYFYHVLKYKNGLARWSDQPMLLTSGAWYDYSVLASNAAVNLAPGVYGLFSGDINQDGSIDLFDYFQLEEAITNGFSGLSNCDLNGDGLCDYFDFLLLEANLTTGPSSNTP